MKSPLALSLAGAVALALGANAAADTPRAQRANVAAQVPAETAALSPKQRGELARQLVLKWGHYVQRVHGVPVDTWASRMVPNLVTADASNFRAALERDTFEGAMMQLTGAGHRVTDEAVITKLAFGGGDDIQTLGALSNDLVYTPITPCRVLDTRNTAAGAIAADSIRSIYIVNASNYTNQGGSATNCGMLGLNATAVAINLTAVRPAGAGYAAAYPYGTENPGTASINYTAGAIVNNALIVRIPNPLALSDMILYSFAESHYVADAVGYFAPPVATALECNEVVSNAVTIGANATNNVFSPACAAGYTKVEVQCRPGSFELRLAGSWTDHCNYFNAGPVSTTATAAARCCRVPGR